MPFNKFENRTIITGQLTAIDPVHIGASERNPNRYAGASAPILKDSDGFPIIPGSSIKGVVRSRFEAIIRSAGMNIREDTNHEHFCGDTGYARYVMKDKSINPEEIADDLYSRSCVVCQLFGSSVIAGKLRFKDCSYIGESFSAEKRKGRRINRDTGVSAFSYEYEIIPKGSRFDFLLIAENLTEEQKKYLDLIITMLEGRLIDGDYLAFGGKTTRGLGRMRLENKRIEYIDAEMLRKRIAERFSVLGENI